MANSRPAPISAAVPPELLERLQDAAATLDLSVNACVMAACRALLPILAKGWKPSNLVTAAGKTYLVLRTTPEETEQFKKSAVKADLVFSDFLRLAAAASLLAIEGKDHVRWPLCFTRESFERAGKFQA